MEQNKKYLGPLRESNPGPLAPEARIIPLNQAAIIGVILKKCFTFLYLRCWLGPLNLEYPGNPWCSRST
jgi:hypothetical protein